MENLIEHEGKKYRVVEDGDGFPCDGCYFELVEETNEKE